MTYRPKEAVFSAPWLVRLPSLVYLGIALSVLALVIAGERAPYGTWLHDYVVLADGRRFISIRTFATLLMVSSVAAVLRSSMRGVRVRGDGLEYRDVISLLVPKLRRFRWAQMDGIVLDGQSIAIDLWDGTRAFLPPVSDRAGLEAALEKVAMARAIPVKGGHGLDEIPDSAEFDEE